jgi:hypothetical protein
MNTQQQIKVEMKEVLDPADIPVVIHGTYQKPWEAIGELELGFQAGMDVT